MVIKMFRSVLMKKILHLGLSVCCLCSIRTNIRTDIRASICKTFWKIPPHTWYEVCLRKKTQFREPCCPLHPTRFQHELGHPTSTCERAKQGVRAKWYWQELYWDWALVLSVQGSG